jgi:hypothetical protein
MLLIGICGKAGAGKGTLANIFMDLFTESPYKRIFPLAEELKRIARDEFGWDGQKDERGRKLLQYIGTECGRMYGGEDFWVNKWKSNVYKWDEKNGFPDKTLVICDDVRFDNEAKAIRNMGGYIVHIVGRAYDMGENSNHPSEAGINREYVTDIISNDGDMESLQEKANILFDFFRNKGII